MVKFGDLPFEHPPLIPLFIFLLPAVTIAPRYCLYRWNYKGGRGFRDLWLPVTAIYLASVLVLSPLGWVFYRYWGLPPAFAKNEIGILVEEVSSQTDREQQIAYQNSLRDRIRKSDELRSFVKVRLIQRPLPPDSEAQQIEALRIGHWLGASYVLRPYVVEGTQEPWLTVVDSGSELFKPESRIGGKFQKLADLDQLPLPKDVVLLTETSLAFALRKRGNYSNAARILGEVLNSPTLPEAAPSRWALHNERGIDLLGLAETTEAIAEFKEAIPLKPDFAEAHNNLGATLSDKGQYDAAIAEYQETIQLKPDFAEAHNNLGAALGGKGQYDAAIAEYKETIRRKPDFAAAHNNLGAALGGKGQYDAAIAEYKETIRLEPDLAEAHNNLGATLSDKGQYGAAIAEYKEAIRLKPDLAKAHNNLGLALNEKGQYDAAVTEYKDAIRLKPELAEAHNNLGAALGGKGQYDAAIAEDREAIRLKPDLAVAHYNLGVALKRSGKSAQASREFKEAHRLDPKITPPH